MRGPFSFIGAGGGAPPPSPPVLTSIDLDLGDTLGGESRILTGTGFTGATSVLNASSFVVDSPTQITAVMASHAAGAQTVSVTTPAGTSGTVAYEYWDPTVPGAATAFFDKGGYALATVSATPNIGRWTKRSGSLDVEMVQAALSAGHSPAVSGEGTPDYDRVAVDVLSFRKASDDTTMVTLEQLAGGSSPASDSGTWFAVLDVDSINSAAGAVYKGDSIVYDNSTNRGGLVLDTTPVARWFWYQGAFASVEIACPASGKFAVLVRRTAGGSPVNEITVDGVTWASAVAGAVTAGPFDTISGTNPNDIAGIFDGRIRSLGFFDTFAWSSGDVTKFFKWVAARFP